MELSEAVIDQRAVCERRGFSWRTVYYGFMRSRRHNLRREEDAEVLFLDWHHPWLFFLAVGTMILSCLDAFMTLQLLERGMVEANPVMAAILGQSTTAFAVSKMTMTGTGILVLVFLAKARFMNRIRIGLFLTIFFSIYSCLVCYEFVHLIKDM
ncbi:MAG: DUF5658 family protein [Gammaproteobacteria bacterium]|nr:DUF5658 family protein [Gammaproteobacteria bacterium]MDH3804226.1 DUF5658 family protein [Gammaproteobacteria bacterium]